MSQHDVKFGPALCRLKNGQNFYCKTHNQNELVKAVDNNQIVVLSGPAGSGKTAVATMLAVKYLKEGVVDKIIVIRPAVEAGGEHLGFLPGSLSEKLDPYLKPIYDMLDMVQLSQPKETKPEYSKGKRGAKPKKEEPEAAVNYGNCVELVTIAHARGRSLNHSFIIFDESQNANKEQMKLVMTRIGFNSKMIINGDLKQSDIGYDNGLRYITEKLKVNPVEDIGLVQFNENDIVRNKIIGSIERLFENKFSNTGGAVFSNKD